MLVHEPNMKNKDPILDILSKAVGESTEVIIHATGIYEISHFNAHRLLPEYDALPDLHIAAYGVCDNYTQVLEQCPELVGNVYRKFVLVVTKVTKQSQPAEGGWRWHKWGPYIGTQNAQHEYLYDEPDVEEVYCYDIFEKDAL